MHTRSLPPEELIIALRAGSIAVLEELYALYRKPFFRWARRRFHTNRQDLEDAWQEAIVALYFQAVSGQLIYFHQGVQAWLFTVGYRYLLRQKRNTKRFFWKDRIEDGLDPFALWPAKDEISAEKKEVLAQAMKFLSAQCREMLVQRYFQEKSLEEIQEEWAFSNINTTSATLSRCLKRLKTLITTAREAIT